MPTESKIELFNKAKATLDRLQSARKLILGLDTPSNDKHQFVARCSGVNGNRGSMMFEIEAGYGYYGNSSYSTIASEEFGRYLAAAITRCARPILDQVEIEAKAELRKARFAAQAEAEDVLAGLGQPEEA